MEVDLKKSVDLLPLYGLYNREVACLGKYTKNYTTEALSRFLLYDFCKRNSEKREEIKKMTKEERDNFYEDWLEGQEFQIYAKRKSGTIFADYPNVSNTSEAINHHLFYNYARLLEEPETTRWELLFELEEFLGPTLDVFLFLNESGNTYRKLQNLQKVNFEEMYCLSIGRELIKHTEEFDGIKVEVNSDKKGEIKIGKLEKFQDIKDAKYPRKYLIKRIENLLKKVEKGLEYPEKNLEEENSIIPRLYPLLGIKNVFPRLKKNSEKKELEKEQPEEVKEARKEKIDIKKLIKEEELKKEINFLIKGFSLKEKKALIGIIFRQILQEIIATQVIEEKYKKYKKLRKNHLEYAYRKKEEEVEKLKKEEKERILISQEDTTLTVGLEGIMEGLYKKQIPTINELKNIPGLYEEYLYDFEDQLLEIYDLAFFFGVYKSLFLFSKELEGNMDRLIFFRENIILPLFWDLLEMILGQSFEIKIGGKKEYWLGVEEIPENGILKAEISFLGKKQEVYWEVKNLLKSLKEEEGEVKGLL